MSDDLLALQLTEAAEGDEISLSPLYTGDTLDDHLDALLDDLAEEAEAGNEQNVEEILVTLADYDQRIDRADRKTRTILRRKKLRSGFRIGRALRRVEGKVKRDLYDALETRTGADRDTLQNYRVVAGHYTPEQVIYDVSLDVYMFLASFPPAVRKHWLEEAHGQAKQTGQPMGKWKIKMLMQEGEGNLTPAQHRETGTATPANHRISRRTASGTLGSGSPYSAPSSSASYTTGAFEGSSSPQPDALADEVFAWAIESLGIFRDELAKHVGEVKANGILVPLVQKGRALFNTPAPAPEPSWTEERYLTPDDLEPIGDERFTPRVNRDEPDWRAA